MKRIPLGVKKVHACLSALIYTCEVNKDLTPAVVYKVFTFLTCISQTLALRETRFPI